jgi:MFS family permease
MRQLFHRFFPNVLGDNPWYMCVEIFWAAVYGSAHTFASAYAIRLGATNGEVSLMSSLPALTAAAVMLPAGRFLQTRPRPRPWLLGSLFVMRVGTLLYILLPWMQVTGLAPGLLFVGVFVALTLPAHFFNLGFVAFQAQAIPERYRADTFAARNILANAVGSTCNFLFGFWLGWMAFPKNYQLLFLVAFAISMVSLYYLSKVKIAEPASAAAPVAAPETHTSWRAFLMAPWRSPNFTRIFVNTLLHSVGLWVAAPLYILYFVRELGATEAWLGVFTSVGNLSAIVGNLFWGRLIHRHGTAPVLRVTALLIGLYPLLSGLIPSLTLILVFVSLNSLFIAGIGLSHFTLLLKLMPEAERHTYVALYSMLMNSAAFFAPLIGVALANQFGFGPVLMGCGLLSIIGSTSFWLWRVEDEAPPQAALALEGG